jgi:uncharacterized protein (TIGR00290 family)
MVQDPSASPRPIALSWSGGKDSALALAALKADPFWRVETLITTVTQDYDRVSMHGVRRTLLEAQAEALELPLMINTLPAGADNATYETAMGETFAACRARGIHTVAFGDLFLGDIRAYRDRLTAAHGISPLYPIWRRDTDKVMAEFLAAGFKAITVCIDPAKLDPCFAGRLMDESFVEDLPPEVDPCGENGEFHSFVFDGPLFTRPVGFTLGELVYRDGFWFRDLTPLV